MALRAGYYGVKRDDAEKLKKIPGISEIGTGLELDEDGELSATGATKTIEGNPEGSATDELEKLQIGDVIYSIPGSDNTKCYQTDDSTESAIVDGDYIPFLDSSAASGAGAPRKSTWSNFKSKLKAFFDGIYTALTSVAPVEDGETSSAAYSVGEHFMRNGGLCVAIAAISSGGTFTENTNYRAQKVSGLSTPVIISSAIDVNSLTASGIYYLVAAPTHGPEGISSFILQNFYVSSTTQVQMAIRGSGEFLYIRTKTGGNWNNWFKFTGTEIVPTP